jgi:hypothetical protein
VNWAVGDAGSQFNDFASYGNGAFLPATRDQFLHASLRSVREAGATKAFTLTALVG